MNRKIGSVALGVCVLGAVTSQSLMDFAMVSLFLGGLYAFFKPGENLVVKPNWVGIEWAYAGYFIAVCLGFYFNGEPGADIVNSLLKFSWVFNFYILMFAFQNVELNMKKIIRYFSFMFLIPNIYALLSYFLGFDILTQVLSDRVVGLLNSATYHAHANALVFVFFGSCLLFCFKFLDQKMKILAVATFVLFGASIFLTFTRGIWLSIFLSSIIMGSLLSFRRTFRFLVMGCLFAGTLYVSWPQFQFRINQSFEVNSSSERINLFKVNVQMFRDYPWFGIGYRENMRRNREYWDRPEWKMPEDYITSHAHNQYLNALSTTGIFGFVFYMSFFIFFIRKNWVLLKKSSFDQNFSTKVILFSCLWAQLEFAIACLTDVGFEYAKIRTLIVVVWALVMALEQNPKIVKEDAFVRIR